MQFLCMSRMYPATENCSCFLLLLKSLLHFDCGLQSFEQMLLFCDSLNHPDFFSCIISPGMERKGSVY